MQHVTESEEIDEIDDPSIIKDLEGVVGSIQELRSKRQRSDGAVSEGETGTITELSSQFRRMSTASRVRNTEKIWPWKESLVYISFGNAG